MIVQEPNTQNDDEHGVAFVRFVKLDDETQAVFNGLGFGEFTLSVRRLRKHITNRRRQGFDVVVERNVLAVLDP